MEYFVAEFRSEVLAKHIWLGDYEQFANDVISAKSGEFSIYRNYAKKLAVLTQQAIDNYQSFICTFVPTIKTHIEMRGYDHARKLATYYSSNLGIECKNLLKPIHSQSQHNLSAFERFNNVKYESIGSSLYDKILLIDDISTTRSSLFHAAKSLKKSGYNQVIALTICYRQKFS